MRALAILLLSLFSAFSFSFQSVSANALADSSNYVGLEEIIEETVLIDDFHYFSIYSDRAKAADTAVAFNIKDTFFVNEVAYNKSDIEIMLEVEVTYDICNFNLFGLCLGWTTDKQTTLSKDNDIWFKDPFIDDFISVPEVGLLSDFKELSDVSMSDVMIPNFYIQDSSNTLVWNGDLDLDVSAYEYYFSFSWSTATEVTVIRLKFQHVNGTVVDTPEDAYLGENPNAPSDDLVEWLEYLLYLATEIKDNWKWVIGAAVLVIGLAFLNPIIFLLTWAIKGIKVVLKMLVDIFRGIAVVVVWLVKAPFRLFRFLFKARSRRIDFAWKRMKNGG